MKMLKNNWDYELIFTEYEVNEAKYYFIRSNEWLEELREDSDDDEDYQAYLEFNKEMKTCKDIEEVCSTLNKWGSRLDFSGRFYLDEV